MVCGFLSLKATIIYRLNVSIVGWCSVEYDNVLGGTIMGGGWGLWEYIFKGVEVGQWVFGGRGIGGLESPRAK